MGIIQPFSRKFQEFPRGRGFQIEDVVYLNLRAGNGLQGAEGAATWMWGGTEGWEIRPSSLMGARSHEYEE